MEKYVRADARRHDRSAAVRRLGRYTRSRARHDGAANFTDQSISAQFWLPEDGTVTVATDAADCVVYLQVALYMETPLDLGSCD